MLEVFYEDKDIIVVKKPAGVESQAVHGFEPDMVSEIRNHIRAAGHDRTTAAEPYVGVIHRLDKPVSGIMVYAKTKAAAAALSARIQTNCVKKIYRAVVCGRCVDNVGNFVDYLLKDPQNNVSRIVEKAAAGAKRAELRYRVLDTLPELSPTIPAWAGSGPLTLLEIELLTGRHHQIRVQLAGHGLPIWGDNRYAGLADSEPPAANGSVQTGNRRNSLPARGTRFVPHTSLKLALCACGLTFAHPFTGETMTFSMEPEAEIFQLFPKS